MILRWLFFYLVIRAYLARGTLLGKRAGRTFCGEACPVPVHPPPSTIPEHEIDFTCRKPVCPSAAHMTRISVNPTSPTGVMRCSDGVIVHPGTSGQPITGPAARHTRSRVTMDGDVRSSEHPGSGARPPTPHVRRHQGMRRGGGIYIISSSPPLHSGLHTALKSIRFLNSIPRRPARQMRCCMFHSLPVQSSSIISPTFSPFTPVTPSRPLLPP